MSHSGHVLDSCGSHTCLQIFGAQMDKGQKLNDPIGKQAITVKDTKNMASDLDMHTCVKTALILTETLLTQNVG